MPDNIIDYLNANLIELGALPIDLFLTESVAIKSSDESLSLPDNPISIPKYFYNGIVITVPNKPISKILIPEKIVQI